MAALEDTFAPENYGTERRRLEDNEAVNRLLAHAAMTTTDGYIRRNAGRKAQPPMREISDWSPGVPRK